jgi:hypothetical protein
MSNSTQIFSMIPLSRLELFGNTRYELTRLVLDNSLSMDLFYLSNPRIEDHAVALV